MSPTQGMKPERKKRKGRYERNDVFEEPENKRKRICWKPWPPNRLQVGAHKDILLLWASRCDTWEKEDWGIGWFHPVLYHHLILSRRVPATTLDKKLTTPLTPGFKKSLPNLQFSFVIGCLHFLPPMIETSLSSWLWVKARFFQWARKPLPTTRKRNLRNKDFLFFWVFFEATWSARAGRNPSLWKFPSQDRSLQPSTSHTPQPFRR